MPGKIIEDADALRAEMAAVEEALEAAERRLGGSVARAEEAVSALEDLAGRSGTLPQEEAEEVEKRLRKARRNAARVRQDGESALNALKDEADFVLEKIRRRLALVEEKISARQRQGSVGKTHGRRSR